MDLIDAIYYGEPLDDPGRPSPEYQAHADALDEALQQVAQAMGEGTADHVFDCVAALEGTICREALRRGVRLSGRFWMELPGYSSG